LFSWERRSLRSLATMKVSTTLYVLCSPLFLLATIAGAEVKGAKGAASARNLAVTTVCYEVKQNPNGSIQVFPGPGAPPVPTSYFMNVFPKGDPAPVTAPVTAPVFQPSTQAYPTTWTAMTVPRPAPAPVPQPVAPRPTPLTPTLGFPSPSGGITVPIPSPPSPPTPPGLGTPSGHGCVEGACQVYDEFKGGWNTIRCPHSCSGCYGVKVHTGNGGSCTDYCVTPRQLNNKDFVCGWCSQGSVSCSATSSFFDTVPEENAPASGAAVSSGYNMMVLGFSIVVASFVAIWV